MCICGCACLALVQRIPPMPAPNTVPLLACAIAFALGTAGAAAGFLTWMVWTGILATGLLGIMLGIWHQHMHLVSLGPTLYTLSLLVVLVATGGLRYTLWQSPPPNSLRTLPTSFIGSSLPVEVAGTIRSPVIASEESVRFVLEADRLFTATDTLRIRDQIQVRWQHSAWADMPEAFPAVIAGERWQMQGRLRPPPAPRNPADFDYGAYLRQHGIYWTLRVASSEDVVHRASAPAGYDRLVHHMRAFVYEQLNTHVHTDAARGIQQALLLGDRSDVHPDHRIHFAATGLMHLLAVSGLHVLLVGLVVYQLLRPMLMRLGWPQRRVDISRAAFTLLLLVTYVALTGARPSVVRAAIMATILIGGSLAQRSYATLNALGAAGLILLWMRPAALYDPGFQLSFAAVTGIVLFNPKLMNALPAWCTRGKTLRSTTQSVTVSAAALLGTAPFLLLHFGFVSIAGLLLNVVAIPITALALSAGILTLVTSFLPSVAMLFGAAADVLTQSLVAVASWGATAFGHWQWAAPYVPAGVVAALSAVLLVFGGMRTWRSKHGAMALLAVLTVAVWGMMASRPLQPTLDILFFDVGQSDAALVRTPDGHHLLVDAGLRTPHSDAAERTILPHLRYAGIRSLDAVLVTHPHADHIGGLPALLRAGVVDAVWDNGQPDDGMLYRDVRHLVDSLDVMHRSVLRGDTLALGAHARVVGLAPTLNPASDGLHGHNEQSVVTALHYGSVQVLFTGDAEHGLEGQLVDLYGDRLQSDIVTAPHHGSITSSTSPFVQSTANPARTHVVISAGAYNMFGFPHPQVVERWRTAAAEVHSTAGRAVWLRTDGTSVWTVNW